MHTYKGLRVGGNSFWLGDPHGVGKIGVTARRCGLSIFAGAYGRRHVTEELSSKGPFGFGSVSR